MRPVLTALLLLAAAPGWTQTLVLSGATVHTAAGETWTPGTVVIEEGRIIRVDGGPAVPQGATVVDLTGKHLYPGLINASTILGLFELRDVRATRDDRELGRFNPHLRAEAAVNPESRLLPVARAGGILTFVTHPQGGLVAGMAAVLQPQGWTVEDMLVEAPAGLVINWPSTRVAYADDKPPAEQRRERRALLDELDGVVHDARAYARAWEAGSRSRDVKWEAMLPVVRGELPIMARVDDLPEILGAIAWADRHGLQLVLIAGRDAGVAAEELAARRIPVVLSGTHMRLPRHAEAHDRLYEEAVRLHEAGVRFAVATGTSPYGTYNARQLADIAGMLTAVGLPREAALRAVTLDAAAACGIDERLGSIEVGKEATLIATDGDVLDLRTRVRDAWIAGRPVDLEDNHHSRLYRKYRAR